MATIATLATLLTAKTGDFEKKLQKARGAVGRFAGAAGRIGLAAGAAAAGGLAALVKQSIDAGDRVEKLARQTGLSTEFLSEIRSAAELSGTSLEAVGSSMKKLQRAAAEARDGTKSYADEFARLGINVDDFFKLSPDQQFNAIATALDNVKDPAQKSATAMALLGRSGVDLIPLFEGGADALDKMREAARKAGDSLSTEDAQKLAAANDAFTNLQTAIRGVGNTLAIEVAPNLTRFIDFLTTRIPAAVRAVSGVFEFLGKLIGGIVAVLVQLFDLNFSGVGNIVSALVGDLGASVSQISSGLSGVFSGTSDTEPVVDEQKQTNALLSDISGKLSQRSRSGASALTLVP